ncbi:hypothetical protein MM326_05505 [Alkalihalobacillus sp. LMS6]|uniref:hypothetical protein n=1 Tax=Bacillaceae TaxID=186817 RepID=UPI000C06DCB3|nr:MULTISPECIES: hypothetical protein [Bacillaceae]UTR07485.1 hypothetical protein MM326_05505 [Alkalihalobacillus sp. LMS6]
MIKKLLTLVPILVLCFATNAYADEPYFKGKEVTDLEYLEKLANDEEHIDLSFSTNSKKILSASSTASFTTYNQYGLSVQSAQEKQIPSVIQLLEINNHPNGTVTESFAITSFATLIIHDDGEVEILSNDRSESQTDSTGSVRASSTIYIDTITDTDNISYARLTSANGEATILQTGVFVDSQNITAQTTGSCRDCTGGFTTQSDSFNTTSFSWNVPSSTTSNWLRVANLAPVGDAIVGVGQVVNMSGRVDGQLNFVNNWY